MSSQAAKPSKPTKPPNQSSSSSNPTSTTPPSRSSSSSLSSHLAMVELKQRILTSLSKLSDRDTHQIAIDDLEKIILSLSPEGIPMLLNCLYDSSSSDPKPSVKKESVRLLAFLCSTHSDLTSTHLTKIIAHIVKRLKDSDSGVKDACRDAIGLLSAQYLKGEGDAGNLGSVVSLFAKPLFEAMNEQNKGVQSGAATCLGKMVECATNPPVAAFQKLCPRICKFLNNPNFLAKAALLPVVASLSQVGALAPQSLEPLMQSIHECLGSTDWATRKAAADALSALASLSSSLITDGPAASTLTVLEACRFDKIKPVRDSMNEALNLWKKISGKGDGTSDGENSESAESSKNVPNNSLPGDKRTEPCNGSPTSESVSKGKGGSISDKAVVILKKRAPGLTDKELNPEFFQKLETRGSGDLPVEVVVPRSCQNSSNSLNEEESDPNNIDFGGRSDQVGHMPEDFNGPLNINYRNIVRGPAGGTFSKQHNFDDRMDANQREPSIVRAGFSKHDGQTEGSAVNNKGNWLAIQRQLLHLERQQAHLMNMLQDFMGGSHDSMLTLESRVRGLERVVEDMARDLSISSGRRGSNFSVGFEGSSNRALGKLNGFPDYSGTKLGRGGDGRMPFGERFARGPPWRSEMPEAWDFPSYGATRNGQMGTRRAIGGGSKSDHESDQVSGRRAWDKGAGPLRLGEGPSARSVWQASKDEATLEAIRVAGDDNGSTRMARAAVPELTAEAMGDGNAVQDRDPVWNSWSNAMDALHVGDMDSAFAEVLSTGDDLLLVKLMDRSGPVIDQLSNEIASEVLHAVGQFLLEQNLFDICLAWIQQLVDVVMENGADVLGIPMEVKKEILFNLHEASSGMDPPEDWEGAAPDQLLLQLASVWGIDLQQFER